MIRTLRALLLVVMALPAPGCAAEGVIAPSELAERLAAGTAPAIIDVRTPQEYAAGHVPGARNIPLQDIAARLGELQGLERDELVVYCESGPRAKVVRFGLARLGFERLRVLDGHMRAWRSAGRPVAHPRGEPPRE